MAQNGNITCALEANHEAKKFIKISLLVGIIALISYIVLIVVIVTQGTIIYY